MAIASGYLVSKPVTMPAEGSAQFFKPLSLQDALINALRFEGHVRLFLTLAECLAYRDELLRHTHSNQPNEYAIATVNVHAAITYPLEEYFARTLEEVRILHFCTIDSSQIDTVLQVNFRDQIYVFEEPRRRSQLTIPSEKLDHYDYLWQQGLRRGSSIMALIEQLFSKNLIYGAEQEPLIRGIVMHIRTNQPDPRALIHYLETQHDQCLAQESPGDAIYLLEYSLRKIAEQEPPALHLVTPSV